MGNANQWLSNAQAKGFTTVGPTATPIPGSVAVWGNGTFGHVAEVVGTIPGGFQVSEENWIGLGQTDIRNVTGSALSGLEGFILPPSAVRGAQDVLNAPQQAANAVTSTAQAIAGLPASVGHGIANATSASTHNVGVWFKNNIVGLVVALVVALVLFGPGDVKE